MPEVVSLGTTLLSVMFNWMLQGFPLMEIFVGARSCTQRLEMLKAWRFMEGW